LGGARVRKEDAVLEAVSTPEAREYETIYILKPDTSKETSEAVALRVADAIKTGGTVAKVENWGRRKLAYEIQRNKRGLYVYFKYIGKGPLIAEVERVLGIQESVMQFHSVKLGPALVANPAVTEDDVRFEHIEDGEDEAEETLAQSLGLEGGGRRERHEDRYEEDDSSDDSDDSDSESSDEEGADA
jgi:small subunit ribosomal protein S6